MTFGLDEATYSNIRNIFKKYGSIEKVILFGSRALGTSRPESDIDLALFGCLDLYDLSHVRENLDELSTPYLFDVVDYASIENQEFKKHIDQYGKVFYERKS